ncbi:LuxR C-terminal-related transcriptional regulator [Flavihumibacter sp. UBA7668]|uniref:LuxR C-terminal-related transcriptional regulator n=1 Tax=Flavihumibacter sp. UBA7668 TaxID=1946542 RepID=UPI0025C05DE5|nr:response regulator transcription factor [Flavihumibacter sp. UBA7668]
MKKRLCIWVIDDHKVVANGIAALLSELHCTRVFYEQEDLLNQLQLAMLNDTIELLPEILIADYHMPGRDPIDFFIAVRTCNPTIKIIVLSMHDSPKIVQDALQGGISGFVLKQNPEQELQIAIELVMNGGSYFSSELIKSMGRLQKQQENFQLTGREKEILNLLAKAFTSKEIASALFISERTVETHRTNLLRKTKTVNTTALLAYARDHFLL